MGIDKIDYSVPGTNLVVHLRKEARGKAMSSQAIATVLEAALGKVQHDATKAGGLENRCEKFLVPRSGLEVYLNPNARTRYRPMTYKDAMDTLTAVASNIEAMDLIELRFATQIVRVRERQPILGTGWIQVEDQSAV